jgi:predicted MFS family arabinose efflux permease
MLVQQVALLAVVVFVAGFAISPMLISGNALVQELVAPTRLTEGLAWIATSIGLGVAAGSALTGAAVDALGAHRAFTVPVVAGLLAAVVVLVFARWLRPVVR